MKIAYEKRKSLYGYGFIALWLVGTVLFFIAVSYTHLTLPTKA